MSYLKRKSDDTVDAVSRVLQELLAAPEVSISEDTVLEEPAESVSDEISNDIVKTETDLQESVAESIDVITDFNNEINNLASTSGTEKQASESDGPTQDAFTKDELSEMPDNASGWGPGLKFQDKDAITRFNPALEVGDGKEESNPMGTSSSVNNIQFRRNSAPKASGVYAVHESDYTDWNPDQTVGEKYDVDGALLERIKRKTADAAWGTITVFSEDGKPLYDAAAYIAEKEEPEENFPKSVTVNGHPPRNVSNTAPEDVGVIKEYQSPSETKSDPDIDEKRLQTYLAKLKQEITDRKIDSSNKAKLIQLIDETFGSVDPSDPTKSRVFDEPRLKQRLLDNVIPPKINDITPEEGLIDSKSPDTAEYSTVQSYIKAVVDYLGRALTPPEYNNYFYNYRDSKKAWQSSGIELFDAAALAGFKQRAQTAGLLMDAYEYDSIDKSDYPELLKHQSDKYALLQGVDSEITRFRSKIAEYTRLLKAGNSEIRDNIDPTRKLNEKVSNARDNVFHALILFAGSDRANTIRDTVKSLISTYSPLSKRLLTYFTQFRVTMQSVLDNMRVVESELKAEKTKINALPLLYAFKLWTSDRMKNPLRPLDKGTESTYVDDNIDGFTKVVRDINSIHSQWKDMLATADTDERFYTLLDDMTIPTQTGSPITITEPVTPETDPDAVFENPLFLEPAIETKNIMHAKEAALHLQSDYSTVWNMAPSGQTEVPDNPEETGSAPIGEVENVITQEEKDVEKEQGSEITESDTLPSDTYLPDAPAEDTAPRAYTANQLNAKNIDAALLDQIGYFKALTQDQKKNETDAKYRIEEKIKDIDVQILAHSDDIEKSKYLKNERESLVKDLEYFTAHVPVELPEDTDLQQTAEYNAIINQYTDILATIQTARTSLNNGVNQFEQYLQPTDKYPDGYDIVTGNYNLRLSGMSSGYQKLNQTIADIQSVLGTQELAKTQYEASVLLEESLKKQIESRPDLKNAATADKYAKALENLSFYKDVLEGYATINKKYTDELAYLVPLENKKLSAELAEFYSTMAPLQEQLNASVEQAIALLWKYSPEAMKNTGKPMHSKAPTQHIEQKQFKSSSMRSAAETVEADLNIVPTSKGIQQILIDLKDQPFPEVDGNVLKDILMEDGAWKEDNDLTSFLINDTTHALDNASIKINNRNLLDAKLDSMAQ